MTDKIKRNHNYTKKDIVAAVKYIQKDIVTLTEGHNQIGNALYSMQTDLDSFRLTLGALLRYLKNHNKDDNINDTITGFVEEILAEAYQQAEQAEQDEGSENKIVHLRDL